MVRTLLVIFFISLMVSAAGFAGAGALGGLPDWSDRISLGHRFKDKNPTIMAWPTTAGPVATRNIVWTGGDDLDVSVPAQVTYIQSADAGIVITGPKNWIDLILVQDGRIYVPSSGRMRWGTQRGDVRIEVRAPSVKAFELNGAQQLVISGYRQDSLEIDVHGAAHVIAVGEARRLDVEMDGAGKGDFGKLLAREARIELNGAGDVTAAPTEKAELEINGVGSIHLLNRPQEIRQAINGIGSVTIDDPGKPLAPGPATPRVDPVKPARATTT